MNSMSRAELAPRPPAPTGRCVAQPSQGNNWGRLYRGADHVRCSHPTPVPAGTRRCEGENGCPFRLPLDGPRVCWYHRDANIDPAPGYADWGGPSPLSGSWQLRRWIQ